MPSSAKPLSFQFAEPHAIDHRTGMQLDLVARPKWLNQSVWPFQSLALQVEGTTVAVTDVGKGPVILLVHTGMWSFIWRDLILLLSSKFRCVCFDAPGTGQSDRLPIGEISLERAARATAAVIEALDLRDTMLVVHDLGGPSGIAGVAKNPDRIRAICAINAFAWRPQGAAFRGMLALMGSTAVREFDVLTQLGPRITRSSFGIGRYMDDESRRAFYSGVGREGTRAFHAYMRDARKSTTIYGKVERALNGPFRQLPLMTIFGERNDPLGFQLHWRRMFRDARQLVVPMGNHFPMCDAPNLVANALNEFSSMNVLKAGELPHDT